MSQRRVKSVRRAVRKEKRRVTAEVYRNTLRLPLRDRVRVALRMAWGDRDHGVVTGRPGSIL